MQGATQKCHPEWPLRGNLPSACPRRVLGVPWAKAHCQSAVSLSQDSSGHFGQAAMSGLPLSSRLGALDTYLEGWGMRVLGVRSPPGWLAGGW